MMAFLSLLVPLLLTHLIYDFYLQPTRRNRHHAREYWIGR
jgi:hypothetical protein